MTHDFWTAGAEIEQRDMEIERLLARLAEAEALLREALEPLADIYYCEKQDCIACRIDAFLAPDSATHRENERE